MTSPVEEIPVTGVIETRIPPADVEHDAPSAAEINARRAASENAEALRLARAI